MQGSQNLNDIKKYEWPQVRVIGKRREDRQIGHSTRLSKSGWMSYDVI